MARKSKAEQFIISLDRKRGVLQNDVKASASYWNDDNWGSIDGINDARSWLRRKLGTYALQRAKALLGTKPPALSKRDTATILFAVHKAIKWEESFVEAYNGRNGKWVRQSKNAIKKMERLRDRLTGSRK